MTDVAHLPVDVIYHDIVPCLTWSERTSMISRDWLRFTLSQRFSMHTWHRRIRMYTYLCVFGKKFCSYDWCTFSAQVGLSKRARNLDYRLTWEAAVHSFIEKRCMSCGALTQALVLGTRICPRCRYDRKRKYAYMVTTTEALQMGMKRSALRRIPYHQHGPKRLRYYHELQIESIE